MEPFNPAVPQDTNSDLNVISENILATHRRFCRISECALLHTEEMHRLFSETQQEINLGDLHSLFMEHRQEKSDLPFSPLVKNFNTISMLNRSLNTAERLAFCRSLADSPSTPENLFFLTEQLFGRAETIDHSAHGRVAYQQNIFTDEAYLHFSPYIRFPRAVYDSSFAAVCEQVYNGLCEFCILPLENSQDGKLLRFYALIEKYELKIVLTTDVTASDKRQTTTFGLCCRELMIPSTISISPKGKSRFEFVVWQDTDYPMLSDILNAVQACALRLIRIDCLPRSDDEIMVGAGYPFVILLDIEQGEIRTFLLFLALNAPFCLPLGLYYYL